MRCARALQAPQTLALAVATLAGCTDSSAPSVGTLRVAISTTGSDITVLDYSVSVDSALPIRIGVNADHTIPGIAAGRHRLELTGLPYNCLVSGPNPVLVTVAANETATAAFAITCNALVGAINVTVVTSGEERDADGYMVTLDGTAPIPIRSEGAIHVPTVREGGVTVALTGVAPNCTVDGPHPRVVTVPYQSAVNVAFHVRCVGTAVLRMTTVTTGVDLDPDRYFVKVHGEDEEKGQYVPVNGVTVLGTWGAGSYDVTLAHVAANCVAGTRTVQVTLAAHATTDVTFNIVCSPTTRLAFARMVDDSFDIHTINSNGTGLARLAGPGNDGEPAWSPDGSRIAFSSDRDGEVTLFVMNADGSSPRRLGDGASPEHAPAWSPNGGRIAYFTRRDGNTEIFVMNADGSGRTRLTTSAGGDEDPAWSPDGTKIAFASERSGRWQIHVMNADGSGVMQLTSYPTNARAPDWSVDGSRIAFARDDCSSVYYCYAQVVVMNANGSNPRELTTGSTDYRAPSWSPDGRWIAAGYQSCDYYYGCWTGIGLVEVNGGDLLYLTDPGSHPSWRR